MLQDLIKSCGQKLWHAALIHCAPSVKILDRGKRAAWLRQNQEEGAETETSSETLGH